MLSVGGASMLVSAASEVGGKELVVRTHEEERNLTGELLPLEKGPSPIRVTVLEKWLQCYPKKPIC